MKGFSLIELLVALAIIAVLITLVLSVSKIDEQEERILLEQKHRTATRMLWLERIDNPGQGSWAWTDEDGKAWAMDRNGIVVGATK